MHWPILTTKPPVHYRITTITLLWEMFPHLVEHGHNERLCMLAGFPANERNEVHITRILEVENTNQSPSYCTAEDSAYIQLMLALENVGFSPVAVAHKHPGTKLAATFPSLQDLTNMRSFEACHPTLGFILTEDGFCRAYTADIPFTLDIVGKGVRRLGSDIFRLEEVEA